MRQLFLSLLFVCIAVTALGQSSPTSPAEQCNLGNKYFSGDGVAKDFSKAAYWYEKSASQGNAEAQQQLGFLYMHGLGVEKNFQKALDWLLMSANQKYAPAYMCLGYLYEDNNKEYAIKWFKNFTDLWYELYGEENEAGIKRLRNLGVEYHPGRSSSATNFSSKQSSSSAKQQTPILSNDSKQTPYDFELENISDDRSLCSMTTPYRLKNETDGMDKIYLKCLKLKGEEYAYILLDFIGNNKGEYGKKIAKLGNWTVMKGKYEGDESVSLKVQISLKLSNGQSYHFDNATIWAGTGTATLAYANGGGTISLTVPGIHSLEETVFSIYNIIGITIHSTQDGDITFDMPQFRSAATLNAMWNKLKND